MENRITPSKITELDNNSIFVFGSNLAGIHGKGAAKTALKWGAKFGQSYGLQGRTFAIPTKDASIKTLSLDEIKYYVDKFLEYAKSRKDLKFLVTEIGCGLAGYNPKDISPLFKDAVNIDNIFLTKVFWNLINEKNDKN